MKTVEGRFWFCDKHGWAGTDEEPSNCCKSRYSMGWYETSTLYEQTLKEQEEGTNQTDTVSMV